MNPDYRRIYHYHVRKTAGSSLNMAFWALGGAAVESSYMGAGPGRGRVVTGNGLRFLRGDPEQIAAGDYFFANAHIPAYQLRVPPGTFTVTILRDPASRAVSYYRYLAWARSDPSAAEREPFLAKVRAEGGALEGGLGYAAAQLRPRSLRTESALRELGPAQFLARLARLPGRRPDFRGFLRRVPPRHLMAQLHMFSKRMDPAEAAERVLACDAVCFTETFAEDLRELASKLDLDLRERQERRFGEAVELEDGEREELRERLAPEFEMVRLIKQGLRTRA